MRPNPSLEATLHGLALGPRDRVAYHRPRGPSAKPWARLERSVRPRVRARAPLVRLPLLRLADGRYWLISHCDHVVTDGLGYASWLAELVLVYSQLCQGLAPSLPPAAAPQHVHFRGVLKAGSVR